MSGDFEMIWSRLLTAGLPTNKIIAEHFDDYLIGKWRDFCQGISTLSKDLPM